MAKILPIPRANELELRGPGGPGFCSVPFSWVVEYINSEHGIIAAIPAPLNVSQFMPFKIQLSRRCIGPLGEWVRVWWW